MALKGGSSVPGLKRGSWQWHVCLHVVLTLGCLMEEALFSFHTITRLTGVVTDLPGTAWQLAHGLGGLALGLIFDRQGAFACALVANLSYLVFESFSFSNSSHGNICQAARIMCHPTLIPWVLALRRAPADALPGVLSRLTINNIGVAIFWSLGGAEVMYFKGGKVAFCSLPVLSLLLSFCLSRDEPGDLVAPKGDACDVELAAPVGRPSEGPAASACELASEASSGKPEALWKIVTRPTVYAAFVIMLALNFAREMQDLALMTALSDPSMQYLSAESVALTGKILGLSSVVAWSFLPAMTVRRLGPSTTMQAALQIIAATFAMDAAIAVLPPILPSVQGFLLTLSLLPLTFARSGAFFVTSLFLVGLVGQGERGVLCGLLAFCGIHANLPVPILLLAGPLYRLVGFAGIFAINAAVCAALVYLFRASNLVNARLKDA